MLPQKKIWLEWRLGRLHVAFSGRYSWSFIPKLAAFLGFGISYIASMARWSEHGGRVHSIHLITEKEAQHQLDSFLQSIMKVRFLEIRNSQASLDYGAISNFTRLRGVTFHCLIAGDLDLSSCTKLSRLSSDHSTIARIKGLSELKNLKTIHATEVKNDWLQDVPNNLENLHLFGRIPKKLELGQFSSLALLNLSDLNNVDFSNFVGMQTSLRTLSLKNIRNLKSLELLPVVFPNLDLVLACELSDENFEALNKVCLEFCQISRRTK